MSAGERVPPAIIVLIGAIVFGVAFAILTPPFATPDETGHWLHAVAVANGSTWKPVPRVTVPRWAVDFLDSYAPSGDVSKLSARPRFAVAVDQRMTTVQLYNVSPYSAIGYLPSALGVWMARCLNLSVTATFRAGRISTTVFCAVMIAAAIASAETGRMLLTLIALTPMAVALRASFSPDAPLLASAVLLAGFLMSSTFAVPKQRAIVCSFAALLMVLVKPPYLPLAALAVFSVADAFPSRRARRSAACVAFVVLVAAAAFTALAARDASRPTAFRFDAPVDAVAQLQYVQRHAAAASSVVIKDLGTNALQYAKQAIGVLGWLDIPLPSPIYWAYAIALILAAVIRKRRGVFLPRAVAPIVLAMPFVLALSVYIVWTPVGADHLDGFQGRYFLPVLPFLIALPPARSLAASEGRVAIAGTVVFASSILIVALLAIGGHYVAAHRSSFGGQIFDSLSNLRVVAKSTGGGTERESKT